MRELFGASVEAGAVGSPPATPLYDGPVLGGCHLSADRSRALLAVPQLGSFAIEEGRRVWVEAEPDADPLTVTAWLHGTVAALLLAQRGRFALHGSVVNVDGAGVALCGRRRAGKSTTALRLDQRGHALVTDDVTPLELDDAGATAHPFARDVHVHRDAADQLGIDVSAATERPVKLSLPGPAGPPTALGAVVVIQPRDGAEVAAVRASGAVAHRLVGANAYRGPMLRRIWQPELFAWAGAVAGRVPVFALTRPEGGWTVDRVADAVEHAAAESRSAAAAT